MSWIFKSLQSDHSDSYSPQHSPPTNPSVGVKDDLSIIGESIGRQLRGVANFLAPPPSPPSNTQDKSSSFPSESFSSSSSPSSPSKSQALLGIRNDLAEIGGSLKSGLSLLSSNKAVSEISKFTSTFLQFQSNNNEQEEAEDYVPGITEEVIDFVMEISMRPECWTGFPLSLETDFEMSDAQREHASTIGHLVPGLAALRANLNRSMDDERFWMIYFILLLPRLNENDFEILSTTQIVETRSALLQKLQNKGNVKLESSENSVTPGTSKGSSKVSERREENIPSREKDITDIVNENIPSREKDITNIVNATGRLELDDEEDADQWLKDTEIDSETTMDKQKKFENEEDMSFSDLEDDDGDLSSKLSGSRQAQSTIRTPSRSGSSDWVQLNESSETGGGMIKATQSTTREKDSDGESTDWHKVDEFD